MVKRGQRLRGMLLVALSLVMLLTSTVPVQAAPQGPAQRLDLVPEGCEIDEHKPGEFIVRYESEEVMEAAPQENVAETYIWGPPSQRLVFDDIKAETDPKKRRVLEEDKKKELEERFGVAEGPYEQKGAGYVWGPDHSPGEFWVRYESEEAMEKAPRENVVEEQGGEGPGYGADLSAQRLRFEEIETETDPKKRRVMEEAEMKRLQKRSGVDRVGYAYPFVHLPGEFRVIYDSEEAMKAVPRKNVVWEEVDTSGPDGSFVGVQDLLFEEIRDESNPRTRRDMEEAKIRELRAQPGVRDATYVPGDADPDCYWDTDVTPEGALNFANARHELYGYICSSGGLEELFGGDDDAQRRLCGIYRSNPEACKITHRPGEFIVHYRSEEAMRSAPRANVVQEKVSDDPHNEFFAQLLVFDEIKDESEPDRQRITRIARLQELEKRPGVLDVRYAIVARERHQKCVDAEFGNFEGPGKPQSGDPVPGKASTGKASTGKAPTGKAPTGKAPAGEPVAGKAAPDEAAPGNKPVASGPSSGKPEPGLYDYVCSPEGLREVFGGDVDFQVWFCIPPGGGGGGGWCYPNCNQGIVDRARELISGDKDGVKAGGKAGGRAAFDMAYEAARSGGSGGGEAASTTSANPGGSGTGGRGVSSAPSKPERAKAEKKDADAGADAKRETGEAADDSDEEVDPYSDGSGSGAGAEKAGAEGPGGGGEAAGAGLQDAGEVSLGGDAADEREGHDGETGGYLAGFLSDAFYFVLDGNSGPADEGAEGMDAAGKETATSETAISEAATDEAEDNILSFLSDPFRGDRGGGAEGGDVELGDAENAAASRDRGTDSSTVVLGVGALLAAGVLVARRFFRR